MSERRMRDVEVAEVRVDGSGRLVVVPRLAGGEDFAFIYRAAMGVAWDGDARALVSQVPQAWSCGDWFRQVVVAVANEYGATLVLTATTTWSVPDPVRRDIEAGARS